MSDSNSNTQTAPPIPDWLAGPFPSPCQPDTGTLLTPQLEPARPLTRRDREALKEQEFQLAFEWAMERVARGSYVAWALEEYHIDINPVVFLRWIRKDPQREALYRDAMECNADYDGGFLAQLTSGMDRNGIPYDPAFINAASSNLKWKMSKHNRKQYGDSKEITVSGGISITEALSQAKARTLSIVQDEIEDAEIIEPPREPQLISHEPQDGDDDE